MTVYGAVMAAMWYDLVERIAYYNAWFLSYSFRDCALDVLIL